MIQIYNKDTGAIKVESVKDIRDDQKDFLFVQFRDYSQEDIDWAKEHFGLDFTILNNVEDIEISSHFFETEHQSAFHFSLPYYDKANELVEASLFLIITDERVISFTSSGLGDFLTGTYAFKFQVRRNQLDSVSSLFRFQIELIADYYADITEGLSKKVKNLASRLLIKKEFNDDDLDVITQLNFNNLLMKESLNEFTKILTVFKKSVREPKLNVRDKIDEELNDLSAVSDYIQFNFDRLDDLKENISNKIDLEQNRIFKILTMVTVCIALPTFIAAIYGMKFEVSPQFKWIYSYPVALSIMALSIVIPVSIFRRRKWL